MHDRWQLLTTNFGKRKVAATILDIIYNRNALRQIKAVFAICIYKMYN